MKHAKLFLVVAVCSFISTAAAHADLSPANGAESALNFAEISLQNDLVQVKLEVDFSDLPAFVSSAAPGSDPAAELSRRIGHTFLVHADGARLSPTTGVVEIRARKPRKTVAQPANGNRQPQKRSNQVVYAVLDYRFEGKPTEITLTPPLDKEGMPIVTIGFQTSHSGVPVTDYRYLSRAEALRPNWDDPWYSAFDNPNLTRHHKSAIMSFLDVGPREIRHEVIFRLRDLETWAELNLGDAADLNATALAKIKTKAIAVFKRSNPLMIDGVMATPAGAKIEQLSISATGLNVLEETTKFDRKTALFGIVLFYPQQSLPEEVEMQWTLFDNGSPPLPVLISDPKGAVPAQITPQDPSVIWKNHIVAWQDPETKPVLVDTSKILKLPHLTLLLIAFSVSAGIFAFRDKHRPVMMAFAASSFTAAIFLFPTKVDIRVPNFGTPDPVKAEVILSGLLSNFTAAMSEKNQDRFKSALQPFVTSENTSGVESEMRRGLSVSLPSGAIAQTDKINDIRVEDIFYIETGSQILGSWNAWVSGGHWGHQHRRIVEYRALLDVVEESGQWKLTGLTILQASAPTKIAADEVKS